MVFVVLVCCFVVIFLVIILSLIKPINYPPGPRWVPFMGSLPELKSLTRKLRGQHFALLELSKKYKTNVLGLKLSNTLVVAVFSYETIRDVLRKEEYDARPDNFFLRLRTMGTKKGITCSEGELWSVQRNFLIRHLRNLGFGKAKMDEMVVEELDEIINIIGDSPNNVQVGRILAPSVLNILWALVAGKRIPRESPKLNKLIQILTKRTQAFDMSGGLLNQFPWLRFIIPDWIGYNLIVSLNKNLKEFLMETVDEHIATWHDGLDDDFIYAFITEMNRKVDPTFTVDQLVMVCLDIFIAGGQATSATIDFAILMMIIHPDIQKKVHDALDTAFQNKNKIIEYRDRLLVPYVEAVLLEVERFCNIVPITGPRRAIKHMEIEGYSIPKDTTILIVNNSINNDPKIWGDPENFRPERFLNENNQAIVSNQLLTFNIGKRRCLGEVLARACVFTFFAGIMRTFSVCIQEGTPFPTGVPVPGITNSPENYVASFTKRHQ